MKFSVVIEKDPGVGMSFRAPLLKVAIPKATRWKRP